MATISCLSVLAPAGTSAAQTSPTGDFIAVYTSYGPAGQGLTGHVFVQLHSASENVFFGKYPAGSWVFNTDGVIRSDADTRWSWRITYPVQPSQYQSTLALLNDERNNPSRYYLFYDNYADFAARMVQTAGFSLPSYRNFLNVSEPRVLYE